MRWRLLVPSLVFGCAFLQGRVGAASPSSPPPGEDLEPAPPPSARLLDEAIPDKIADIDSWFAGRGARRLYVQLDRPLYRPGESVWVKTWSLAARGMAAAGPDAGVQYELVDPRGQVVETKRVAQRGGTATNDFVLPVDAAGGRWTLRATSELGGDPDERPFVVASYQAPRLHKTLDFVREAYGPGQRVEALVEIQTATGSPLANHPVRALLQVDGDTVIERELSTDETGAVYVSADLPAALTSSDGLLTVLVDEGGITESISRSVPIVLADLKLAFYPEGGDLVAGLPGRVYFEGQDRHGEPADVEGFVEDDRGQRVASFASVHDGLGRLAFTPERGRRYVARVTAPEGLAATYPLPEARDTGCVLRAFDDLRTVEQAARVGVRCTSARDVFVTGVLHDTVVDTAGVRVGPGAEAVVYLSPPPELANRQGAMRVTVFDRDHAPLAERLIYRNHGDDLRVTVTPDRAQYGPRDEVVLKVQTTDPNGAPLPAEIALSVVDDAVLGLADDEEGNMLTRLYLEPELVDSPDDPAWYFDPDEPLAARGVDLVLGTRGYRRFEWAPVFEPPPPALSVTESVGWGRGQGMGWALVADRPVPSAAIERPEAEPMRQRPAEAPAAVAQAPLGGLLREDAKPMAGPMRQMAAEDRPMAGGMALQARGEAKREWFADDLLLDELGYRDAVAWAPVRVFPKPTPEPFTGVRSDFRDTVAWEPAVRTDNQGLAEVRFYLSDALTTFRVTAEGLGGGFIGRREVTLASVLPVSVAARLPVEVTAGDKLLLPLTVTNTRANALSVGLTADFGSDLLRAGDRAGALSVPGAGSATWWVPVEVGQGATTAALRFTAEGGGSADTVEQTLRVVPAGFPRAWSAAGSLATVAEHSFVLEEHQPGSLRATVTWHPSTTATLLSGMEGLISTPGGCFEQTSSTNWPNVAILSYLEAHDGDPRLRAKSASALQEGYNRLSGYQVDAGGFETWGSGPGKEALSAFGLLQFTDMKRVYPVADSLLKRDADYLLSQRDGKGGFKNSGESAHGYGAAPQPVLDGFITWALVSTGHSADLGPELARQANVAVNSKDPYVLALAARSLVAAKHPSAKTALSRLKAMQATDGSFPGAESSITRSWEANLLVESTALATLALLEGGETFAAADKGADWLVQNRQGVGTWGATQATALALSALTSHAERARAPSTDGDLVVEVNGQVIGELRYTADQSAPLVMDDLARALKPGKNKIVLRHRGGEPLPYTVDIGWSSLSPASAPGAELSLTTALDRTAAPMGETVRLTARVENRTDAIVPSPIARIGLPAGLEAQTWQLQELQDRGQIAFFETRPREVILYWDGLHVEATHEVKLDLLAAIPGTTTGPASSAWPYYDDDEKSWSSGLRVTVSPPPAK